jgi:hypothetical protein
VDLFKVIDIVAIKVGHTLGVQCTTMNNKGTRVTKIKNTPEAELWTLAGNLLEVWCWRKLKGRWEVDITEM